MNRKKPNLIFYSNIWLPPILWAALIFFLSAQSVLPKFDASILEYFSKKLSHMTVYGVLYLLFWRAIKATYPESSPTTKWLAPLVLCLLYAFSDEIHQSFVPGRFATLRDIGYDLLGVTTALLWRYKYV